MLVRLSQAAVAGLADPRTVLGPFIDLALHQRERARARKDFDESDLIRDQLAKLGVVVRDTPTGQEWTLT